VEDNLDQRNSSGTVYSRPFRLRASCRSLRFFPFACLLMSPSLTKENTPTPPGGGTGCRGSRCLMQESLPVIHLSVAVAGSAGTHD